MRFLPTLLVAAVGSFHQHKGVLGSAVIRSRSVASHPSHHHHQQQHRRLAFDPNDKNDKQPQYLAWQEGLTNGTIVEEWEWVLVRIQGVTGLENADWLGQADPVISVAAQGAETLVEPPGVEFHKDQRISNYVFTALDGTNEAQWYVSNSNE